MPQRGCGSSTPAPSSDRAPTNKRGDIANTAAAVGHSAQRMQLRNRLRAQGGLHRNTPPRE
eukprot:4150544-Alexandrium_andersonii.AAC.1